MSFPGFRRLGQGDRVSLKSCFKILARAELIG